MKKLTQYLLKKFISNLFVAITGWIVIFILINMIEKVSTFIDHDATLQQFLWYYVLFIPQIINLTLPIAMLLAALFAVSNLAQNNELVAQFSAGISLYKILNPLLLTAFAISIIAGLFSEYIVPLSNQNRLDLLHYEIEKKPRSSGKFRNNVYVQDTATRKMSIKYYNGKKNEGTEVSLQTFSGSILTERIDAKKMKWQDSVWVLYDATLRTFSNDLEQVTKVADTTISDSKIKPQNLIKVKKKPEEMSYSELNTFISDLRNIGANPRKWLVERHLKIALPFANFIVVLIGAPFASRKRRGGSGLSFGLSLLISFSFFIFIFQKV